MENDHRIRIDKWLYAVRQFKSRSIATMACDQGRVFIQEQIVKPSRLIKAGDQVKIKRTGLTRTLLVKALTENRLNAKLVSDYYADLTPQEEIDEYKARISRASLYRLPGAGRPTKKERRALDDFIDDWDLD